MTYLNIYKGFLQSGKSSQWCHNNFINYQGIVRCYLIIYFHLIKGVKNGLLVVEISLRVQSLADILFDTELTMVFLSLFSFFQNNE